MTHAQLNASFNKMEAERNKLLDNLQTYDDAILNKKPMPEAWSVIEILHHLIAAEEASVNYLKKKTQDLNGATKVGLKEKFRSLLLNWYLSSPIKFKAPAVAAPTVTYATLKDTRNKWDTVRADLQETWIRLPEEKLNLNWYKHTAAGKLGLNQMLQFISTHVNRHTQQVGRTLKTVS
jgi:uncharacterized damage-inducible protein DinB